MKTRSDTLIEQVARIASEIPPDSGVWNFSGDFLAGEATWSEIVDGQSCVIRLVNSTREDLEVNYAWPTTHFMRGIFLIINTSGSNSLGQFKMRQGGTGGSRSYVHVPSYKTSTESMQKSYTQLFFGAKESGLSGVGFPGDEWELTKVM